VPAAFGVGDSLTNLSPKQAVFVAAYIGQARKNATEAARIAGYTHPNKQGPALLVNLGIKTAIDEHLAEIKRQGIAHQQNRVDELVGRHNALKQIAAERAADPFYADIPGGTTGFVHKKLKNVTHAYEKDPNDPNSKARQVTVERWEVEDNVALLREMREHEKQVAQELGEWTEKSEFSGPGGETLTIRSISVPLPVRGDDQA
jgi:hypothetical protein